MTTLSLMPYYYAIAGAGGSTPVFVGSNTFTSSTTSVVVNITTGIPQAAIVFILVGGGPNAGSQQATSVSDGGLNPYTKTVGSGTTTSMGTSLWYTATQIPSSIASNQSFSANWGSFLPTIGFISVAYSPTLLSTSLDKIGGNGNVSGTTATSVIATSIAQASELVIGATFIKSTSTSVITESAGYTTIDSNNTGFSNSSCSYDWGYIITSTTSSIGYAPTYSTSVTASTAIISTYK